MELSTSFFNLIIVSVAGFIFGWAFAFYTAIGIFVNGRVIDMIYTQNQKNASNDYN